MFHKPVLYFLFTLPFYVKTNSDVSAKLSKIWGPGLQPHVITMPARYFFIQAKDTQNNSIVSDLGIIFDVALEGTTLKNKPCRIWKNELNRKDGFYIIRYKLYEPCVNFKIIVKYQDENVAESPYKIPGYVYPDNCDCSKQSMSQFLNNWNCGHVPKQIRSDLGQFDAVNWDETRKKVIKKFNQPHSISLCHYIIKDNYIHRNCYGKYVGFKMFMDSILLSLSRKISLPDLEFFVNLGDWPLVHENSEFYPIFSWCASKNTQDIVMPTYDITESTLENMGRVMLDMLSVQGNVESSWENRTAKVFWRGRDSNEHRLRFIEIARENPDLFNASLTNFFFFKEKQDIYGPKSEHVSFFSFFNYKYQVSLDGTVAAYRFPYLLAGGSLVFKQDSQYYEHFYNDLIENTHYVAIERDLSDLMEKVTWALNNDNEAYQIAKQGQAFANEHLLPQNIFCYYAHLLNEFSGRITSKVKVLEGMENVTETQHSCDCVISHKDEL